jgi:hypothetical protein
MNNKNRQSIWELGFVLFAAILLLVELTSVASAMSEAGRSLPSSDQRGPQGSEDTYTITINKVGEGNVSLEPDQPSYEAGVTVTLSAMANAGWQFTGWSGDLSGSSSPAQIVVSANHVITATFEQRCFELTLSHSGTGEDPVASPTNSDGCSAGQYHAGDLIGLTAAPAAHWAVSGWTGTANDVSTATGNTVTMPAGDHSASVAYSAICFNLNTSVSPPGAGSITRSADPNCPSNSNRYLQGTQVTLTAIPGGGNEFINWSGSVSGSVNPVAVTMNGNRNVTAHFGLSCYTLVRNHTGSGSDPVAAPLQSAGCSSGKYFAGEEISLTATPDLGWQVNSWSGTEDDTSKATSNELTMPAVDGYAVAVNYVALPTLQFASASYSVNEDQGMATVQVVRSGSPSEEVSVQYSTANGTAEAGEDYTAASGSLTFATNVMTRSLSIVIMNDSFAEGSEHFAIELLAPTGGAQLGTVDTAAVTILDDEGEPTVQFSNSDYVTGEGSPTAPISVTLFPASTVDVFVDFATADGSATAGADYQTNVRTIRFNPGETSKLVNIQLISDSLDEMEETVLLSLSDVSNAELGNASASLTIADDDDPPAVRFGKPEYFVKEGAPTAPISITLDAPSSFVVSVNYEVTDVVLGRQSLGVVSFLPGETVKNVEIDVSGKAAGDELILVLRSPQNAILGTPATSRMYILDKDRSECHPLTLSFSGLGSAPQTTNLLHSLGCPTGQFVAGELINVLAAPESGWRVQGWQGTLNDNSNSLQNIVQMPDADHIVIARYITSLFLPVLTDSYATYFAGPQEREPNNSFSSANGPLRSAVVYQGRFPDASDNEDIFFFYLPTNGIVQTELKGIPQGHDYSLYLYSATNLTREIGYSNEFDNADETISLMLAKGLYYIRVHRDEGSGAASAYELNVIYQ